MNEQEVILEIDASRKAYEEQVKSILTKFDPISNLIKQINKDIENGPIKPTKHTIYSSITDDHKIGIRLYLKSGTYRFSVLKSQLKLLYAGYVKSNLISEIVDEIFTSKMYGEENKFEPIDRKLRSSGLSINLASWMWSQVSLSKAQKLIDDTLTEVSKRDLSDDRKKEQHTRRIALKRLKKWALAAADFTRPDNHDYKKQLKAKLPSKDKFLELISIIKERDNLWSKGNEIDKVIGHVSANIAGNVYSIRRYSGYDKDFLGISDINELIFVYAMVRAAACHTGEYIAEEYQPSMKDVDEIYKYLVAKSIIEM